jgi:hypothetical protein
LLLGLPNIIGDKVRLSFLMLVVVVVEIAALAIHELLSLFLPAEPIMPGVNQRRRRQS